MIGLTSRIINTRDRLLTVSHSVLWQELQLVVAMDLEVAQRIWWPWIDRWFLCSCQHWISSSTQDAYYTLGEEKQSMHHSPNRVVQNQPRCLTKNILRFCQGCTGERAHTSANDQPEEHLYVAAVFTADEDLKVREYFQAHPLAFVKPIQGRFML